MSTWGIGAFENDDAADLDGIWEAYLTDCAPTWGEDKTLKFFEQVYFSGALPTIGDGNSKTVIAIGLKFYQQFGELPKKLHELVATALAWESTADQLAEWGSRSSSRSLELQTLAEKLDVDIKLNSPQPGESIYAEEIASLKTWLENLPRINAVRESMSVQELDFFDSIKPEFGKQLEACTWDFSDDSDEDGAAELGNLRFLYLVWFALFNAKFDSNEIIRIIEQERT